MPTGGLSRRMDGPAGGGGNAIAVDSSLGRAWSLIVLYRYPQTIVMAVLAHHDSLNSNLGTF